MTEKALNHRLAGWIFFALTLVLGLIVLRTPWIADGLLWRFESIEPKPRVSQRMFERLMHRENIWQDSYVPKQSVILFGDSHLQLIPRSYLPSAYNFAVSGQSVGRMVDRVAEFTSLGTSTLIILNGGENDLSEGATPSQVGERWQRLLGKLRPGLPITCVGLPETNATRIHSELVKPTNTLIEKHCISYGGKFLPLVMGAGAYKNEKLSDDKLHLSENGIKVLAEQIRLLK